LPEKVTVTRKKRQSVNPPTPGERVFREWHDFGPSGKTPVKMPRQLSAELVMLGECDGILYASDKWNPGKVVKYIHKFKRGALPVLLYDPINNYLVIPGPPISGDWKVTKDGLVD
jgi:hypothetical protein